LTFAVTVRDRGLKRALDRLREPQTKKLARLLGRLLVRQTEHRIAREKTGPDGKPWARAKVERAKGRARDAKGRFRSTGLLVRSGTLLGSIRHGQQRDDVHVGTDLAYAAIHQLGGKRTSGGKGTPRRAFLGVSEANKAEANAAIERELKRLLGVS
jgi:phage virion morphogenesis protein